MDSHHIQTADQVPAAALQIKVDQLMDAIAFINATYEHHREINAFSSIVDLALNQNRAMASSLAQAFEVNAATVSRWKSGKNAPHPRERTSVIEWLKDALKLEIAEARNSLNCIEERRGRNYARDQKRAVAG